MLRLPAVSYSTSEFAANMTINVRNDFEKTSAYLDSRSLTSSCYTEKSTNIKWCYIIEWNFPFNEAEFLWALWKTLSTSKPIEESLSSWESFLIPTLIGSRVVIGSKYQWSLGEAQLTLWCAVWTPLNRLSTTAVGRARGLKSSQFRSKEPARSSLSLKSLKNCLPAWL